MPLCGILFSMRILAASDIHLGRRPRHGESGHESWQRVVDTAIDLAVDVLLLAGDVIEHERAWLSVYAPLVDGLKRLAGANIRTIAVAGNHDWEVFGRLAAEEEAITILGNGGKWESIDYRGVRFIGWSFGQSHHDRNPFDRFPDDIVGPLLSIGVLHTDLGVSASRYAPTQVRDFEQSAVPFWVLGHIHKGGPVAGNRALYCGSPIALDSSERGAHGVWLIEAESTIRWKEPLFIPLSPLRYEEVACDVTDLVEVEDVRSALRREVRAYSDGIDFSGTLYVTVRFTGSRAVGLSLDTVMGAGGEEVSFPAKEGIACTILPGYIDATGTAIDLASLAAGSGADAQLARLLGDDALLLELYRRFEGESMNVSAYSSLGEVRLDDDEALREAKRAGLSLLEAMASEKQGGV